MKQYIKNGKLYNLPITISKNGKLIITNNEELILANGFDIYEPLQVKPDINVLIQKSNDRINAQTDKKILNDFIWNDNQFYLTLENQTNFANMFIAREYLTFPQKIKSKRGFYEIQDKEQCEQFYLAGINFVKQCLEFGWKQKEKAEDELILAYNEN